MILLIIIAVSGNESAFSGQDLVSFREQLLSD